MIINYIYIHNYFNYNMLLSNGIIFLTFTIEIFTYKINNLTNRIRCYIESYFRDSPGEEYNKYSLEPPV